MVISKIAGFLRGLVSRGVPARPAAPAPTQAAQKSQKRGVPPPAAKPGAGRPAPAPAKAPQPAAKPPAVKLVPAKPAAVPDAKPVPAVSAAKGEEIELPLAPIVASLPPDLRAKLMANPAAGQTIRLPAEAILQQLAFGAVRISFGELRGLAPGLFTNSGGELDIKQVNLPLQEILSRVNPTLLARRSARKVEVADDIVGPFGERGRGFSFTTQPLKSASASPQARQPEPPLSTTPPAARQVAPLPATNLPAPPQRPVTPAAPTPPAQPLQSRTTLPPPSSLRPAAAPPGSNGHGTTLPPGLKLAGSPGRMEHPSAPKPSMPAHSASAPPPPTITPPLGELCENWPEDLKHAILESPLARTNVPLDGGLILPGLKRGRVVMTWKQLRLMAQPTSSASPWDALELELPLKVIAPLFMAAQKPGPKAPTKAVSTEIPDLFFGFPQPSTPVVVTPAATIAPAPAAKAAPAAPPAPAPVPVVTVAPPAVKQAEAKPKETNFYSRSDRAEMAQGGEAVARADASQTDFTTRQAHPKDVVGRAAALPGVAGSVVAMQDGLRVASQVPADLNADTLAAFLPQIFDRLNHSTREMRMGPLNNISFTVGQVPWRVFRVNSVYFAAFGRAGESLPVVQLVQLAEELDRKKQQ
ncbi:MAG TPA: hypothetical protein VF988_11455 [Verrucomicrobiae bacterium]